MKMPEPLRTHIPATDGYNLASTLYEPPTGTNVEKAVVIGSAAGASRRYYHRYAQYLAESGFAVVTFDYRGVGESRPARLRTFQATMREWGQKDLAGVISWMVNKYESTRLMMVGHSAGGQMLGLAGNNAHVTALLSVASQSGYWGLWDAPARYQWAFFWCVVIPVLTTLFSYCPTKLLRFGDNLPAGVGLEWARWCRNPNFIVDSHGKPLREHFTSFSAPILAYSFADDPNAPRRAVSELLSFYANAKKEHRHLQPEDVGAESVGHFGFFRKQFKSSLWRESVDWLNQH